MRERVEDLGRLMVLLKEAFNNKALDFEDLEAFLYYHLPPEHNPETVDIWIDRLEKLHENLSDLRERIAYCLRIAAGQDPLNEKPPN